MTGYIDWPEPDQVYGADEAPTGGWTMVEKDIPVDDIGFGKLCQCGQWNNWEDYEEGLWWCECGRHLAMTEKRHCSTCHTETTSAPLCDKCARILRRDCQLVHLALVAGTDIGSGVVGKLRRDEALLTEYDEWKEEHEMLKLNLNEITAACEALTCDEHRGWTEGEEFIARSRTWLPALVAELREARAEIERLRALVPPAELRAEGLE